MATASELYDWVRSHAHPLDASPSSLDPLLEAIGDAPIVLLGEGTHGTAEFYQIRQQITQRLIREKGFNFVAIEGDWPDAYRVNRFVRGETGTPRDALMGFERFPRWVLIENLSSRRSRKDGDHSFRPLIGRFSQ